RVSELDKSGTGSATVKARDFQGVLDATNPDSPFAGKIESLKQAAFFLTNPATGDEKTLFRGLIADIDSQVDESYKFIDHTITIVDLMDVLTGAEVVPDATGVAPFVATDVQTRILAALADADIPSGLVDIFTGNVNVLAQGYSAGEPLLTVVQDAADA